MKKEGGSEGRGREVEGGCLKQYSLLSKPQLCSQPCHYIIIGSSTLIAILYLKYFLHLIFGGGV